MFVAVSATDAVSVIVSVQILFLLLLLFVANLNSKYLTNILNPFIVNEAKLKTKTSSLVDFTEITMVSVTQKNIFYKRIKEIQVPSRKRGNRGRGGGDNYTPYPLPPPPSPLPTPVAPRSKVVESIFVSERKSQECIKMSIFDRFEEKLAS